MNCYIDQGASDKYSQALGLRIWLGEIIDRCLTDGGYADTNALANQLEA